MKYLDSKEVRDLINRYQNGDSLAWQKLQQIIRPYAEEKRQRFLPENPKVPGGAVSGTLNSTVKETVLNYDTESGVSFSYVLENNIDKDLKTLRNKHYYDVLLPTEEATEIAILLEEEALEAYKQIYSKKPSLKGLQRFLYNNYGIRMSLKELDSLVYFVESGRGHERSANEVVGRDCDGEILTLGDIYFVGEESMEEYHDNLLKEEELEKALSTLDPQDRDLFEQHKGLGKYEGKKTTSYAALALNNNLRSPYEAKEKIDEITKKLKRILN